MDLTRRRFLTSSTGLLAAGGLAGLSAPLARAAERAAAGDWSDFQQRFNVDHELINLAGMLLAPHPAAVRAEIDRQREALDRNPPEHVDAERWNAEHAARRAAARYLGGRRADIALTESTTMGIALAYNGIRVEAAQELLTSEQDYYATHKALEYKQRRSGAALRTYPLYEDSADVREEALVARVVGEIRPETRLLALTWVHSLSGLKLPVARIGAEVAALNEGRAADERVLVCVDGVHALGVEDFHLEDLNCDFFFAGTHKWLFGPRGTGILWGHPRSQEALTPTIPTFTADGTWGGEMTPGGFKAFEHVWALPAAFELHTRLGKANVQARIHALNRRLKEGLADMAHVVLRTPMDEALSAGITCFDVNGMDAEDVVDHLRTRRIIASITPYATRHARLTPGLLNDEAHVDAALAALAELA
ncbi:aminotransferase class V-fold PLP-dependent enzyme [Ectothiorhodospiraceae bacterium 2226]|nr:aminotransferase class V-fold PLP-dependent enzyme [Ectothiorhodospiraceae bacterium 2226]